MRPTQSAPSVENRIPLVVGLCGLVSLLAAAVLLMTGAQDASDAVGARIGNKGSIDVADTPYSGNPHNDPKVSCSVTVLFFDFEAGTPVTSVEFERPGSGTPVLTGGGFTLTSPDPGRDGLNAQKSYDLEITVSQDDAGKSIPLKVTAFVTHDGKAQWKSKVFKCVAGDEPTEATTDPTEATTDPTEATTDPTEATTDPTEATTDPTEATTDPTNPTTTVPTEAGSSDVGGLVTENPSDGAVAGADEDADVPQVIDAGATGWTTRNLWGAGLAGGGVALLVSALVMSVMSRPVSRGTA